MTTLIITYDAKCKDCIFLKEFKIGKRKLRQCTNKASIHYLENRQKKQLACKKIAIS